MDFSTSDLGTPGWGKTFLHRKVFCLPEARLPVYRKGDARGCLPVRMRVLAQAPQLPERRQIRQEVECSRGSTTAHLRGRRQGGAPPDSRREMASTVTPAGVALILCPSLVLSTHVPPPHVKWSRSPDLGVGGELSDPAAQPPGAGGSAGTAPARARQLCGAFSHCLPVRL